MSAIGHLHKHDVAHRDVAPDNLMLTRDVDGRPLVKLIDLGIAKDIKGDSKLTGASVFLGKFRYASPETFEDQAPGDPRRSDLYSFALVLYELLTGRFPIAGESASSLIAGHLFRPPLDFAESDPEGRVPEHVRRAILQALAKTPGDRFADAASFKEALGTGPEVDLSSPDIARVLELTRDRVPRPSGVSRPPGSTQSRLDLQFAAERTPAPVRGDAQPLEDAPTRILRPSPPLAQEGETHILRPSPNVKSGAETRRLDAHELRAMLADDAPTLMSSGPTRAEPATERMDDPGELCDLRTDAARVQKSAVDEDSTTVIRVSVPEPEASDPEASTTLDETLRSIRALRDDGRAGEALEELNRAVREFGSQPTLRTLRDELGEALLERDEEEESASQMFEVAPPADSTMVARPPTSSGAPPPIDASTRGLSAATIRSFDGPSRQTDERPGPPTAPPTRNMLAVGLILAVVFGALVFLLTREKTANEPSLEVEDVEAAELSPGSLALDAVPWGELVALDNPAVEDDPAISPSRFTPVILSLPPGEYKITLRYPPTGQVEERVVRVVSDARVEQRVTFESLDAESYFKRIDW